MQIEITLTATAADDYAADDLGRLLHKNPAAAHRRDTAAGPATVFFREISPERTTAVLTLEIDPIALVRGKAGDGGGPLAQYVNDRPYVANSFLSVALGRSFGQSFAGKSKERQALADRALPFEARVVPVAVAGGRETVEALFAPLGYRIEAAALADEDAPGRTLFDLRLAGAARLRDLLSHLYVLTPVLDNAKHYWIDREEIETLLAKGAGWLAEHPAKALIAARALRHRRALVATALQRLDERDDREAEEAEAEAQDDGAPRAAAPASPEAALEAPIRLHDLRLDAVADTLAESGAKSVLDLGCGEGRLIRRLLKTARIERILGVDAGVAALERAARRLRLDEGGPAARRVALQLGSLTYGDRRWRGFDAAALVEVIEHVDPPRLSALALSLFGDARPALVVITTPNREHNALFEGMAPGALRHPDHRFEWTRAEFAAWTDATAEAHGYRVERRPLGPEHEERGPPSQMAVFTREAAA